MALTSGQMAGLSVPATTMRKVSRFLDSVEGPKKGAYAYLPGNDAAPAMTAAGMLCRLYLGQTPNNPGLLAGAERLKKSPPGKTGNLYYEYYATQVMHHMGGESWKFWNEGPDGKSGIRDSLISRQDAGVSGKKGNAGSWPATEDFGTQQGGRLMATSLSLLTLEVYYRHLPLYLELALSRTASKALLKNNCAIDMPLSQKGWHALRYSEGRAAGTERLFRAIFNCVALAQRPRRSANPGVVSFCARVVTA